MSGRVGLGFGVMALKELWKKKKKLWREKIMREPIRPAVCASAENTRPTLYKLLKIQNPFPVISWSSGSIIVKKPVGLKEDVKEL